MRTIVMAGGLLAAGVVVLGITAQSAPPAANPTANSLKVGYINSERLIREAPGATEAQTTLRREMDKLQADLALAEDSLRNQVASYQQKSVMLSADSKKKEEDALRAKQAALAQRQQNAEQLMEKRQRDLVQPIMERINKVIEDVRKEQGYMLIFNAPGAIVAADTTLDLTSTVLARLKGPASATPPKKPGG